MNLLRKVCLFGVIALVFMSCSDKNEVINPGLPQGKTPIRLSSSVNLLRSDSQNTQIVSGQKVGFFLNTTGKLVYNINNEALTADGEGGFTHSSMYYPTEGETFEFSAYHPYSETGLSGGFINFSINADQSVKTDYLNSDLIYSNKEDIERTQDAVPLTFVHKLSRVTFVIKKGDGVDIGDLNKIEILNVLPSVKMNIIDGELSNVSGDPATVNAFGVTGSAEEGVLTLSGSAAIIVPQIVDEGSKLLRITIGETIYTYTTVEDIEFEGGNSYEFQIEISSQSVLLSSTISNWGNGGSISGDGVIE